MSEITKSYNYNIDYMMPDQIGKEIIFNESLILIDNFLNYSVKDFIEDITNYDFKINDKFIIIDENNDKGKIIYCDNDEGDTRLLSPKDGMTIFVRNHRAFYIYDSENNIWQKQNGELGNNNTIFNTKTPEFCTVRKDGILQLNKSYICLFLDRNVEIFVMPDNVPEITIIIKQHYENVFNIKWNLTKCNILWPQNNQYQVTQNANAIDIIKLYKLGEENCYLCQVVNQGYSY